MLAVVHWTTALIEDGDGQANRRLSAMDLSQQDQRRHAFRQELARACESLGVFVSA